MLQMKGRIDTILVSRYAFWRELRWDRDPRVIPIAKHSEGTRGQNMKDSF